MKHGFSHFKPVILFRSKLIEDSKRDFEAFKELIRNLSVKDFNFFNEIPEQKATDGAEIYEKGKSRIIDIKHFIIENKIEWSEIIAYLQYTFAERNCVLTNSKSGTKTIEKTTEDQEKLLNSLEDKSNTITAIFTVQRLTEGWDVLNLFDIVRLYEGQNEGGSNTKTSEATTSEVQLIGRGVRYYPFAFESKPLLKRKFDDDLQHELRVLEEFYYHSDDEHRYLSQLKNELKNKGYLDERKKIKKYAIKKEIKQTEFYKAIMIWKNTYKPNPDSKKTSLEEIRNSFVFNESVKSFSTEETRVNLDKEEDTARYVVQKDDGKTLGLKLRDFEKHLVRKAINIKAKHDRSLLRFEHLKDELNIESIDDLYKKEFLGDFSINLVVPRSYKELSDVPNRIQLEILLRFFNAVERRLKEISNPYIGEDFFAEKLSSIFDAEQEKLVIEDEDSKQLEKELTQKSWYMLDSFSGTSEERSLVYFLKDTMVNLENKYEQVFLLRNEEVYTIYDFGQGRGFQPDFLLFLKQKEHNLYYQVFIEPKGDQFADDNGGFTGGKESWKQEFLDEITKRYGGSKLLEYQNDQYKLIGLPLYNNKRKEDFRKVYNVALSVS